MRPLITQGNVIDGTYIVMANAACAQNTAHDTTYNMATVCTINCIIEMIVIDIVAHNKTGTSSTTDTTNTANTTITNPTTMCTASDTMATAAATSNRRNNSIDTTHAP